MSHRLAVVTAILSLAPGCKRDAAGPSAPARAPMPPSAPTPPPPATPAAPAAQPSGPRAELSDPRFKVLVVLASGAAPSDPARLTLELRGQGGYHVNEQYPIAVNLTVEHATTEKPLLVRADAAEVTQAVARFDVAVRPTGAHPTVRGRLRFAVCTEAQCAFETREFAVAL